MTHTRTGNLARGRLAIWLITNWRHLRDGWRVFRRNPLALIGVALLIVFALMALSHPVLMNTVWPRGVYDPEVGYDLTLMHPSPPGPGHLLGTDTLGRDVLSMLLAATRPTFTLAITAALTTALISTLLGAVSAYYRGWIDQVTAHASDAALLVPPPLVLIVLSATLDIQPVPFGLIYGALAGISGAAIVMRSHALTLIAKPFVEASRVAGAGAPRIIFRHLVPHLLPLGATYMLISVVGAVFADGFAAFLGISRVRLNWGQMIYASLSHQAINPAIPWNVLVPSALAISLFAMSFYLIARGLHEVAEPRLRARL